MLTINHINFTYKISKYSTYIVFNFKTTGIHINQTNI
jgi:hypothetical protein